MALYTAVVVSFYREYYNNAIIKCLLIDVCFLISGTRQYCFHGTVYKESVQKKQTVQTCWGGRCSFPHSIFIRNLEQQELWHRKCQKWQLEVFLFSLMVLWLDKFVAGVKKRHSDLLCEIKKFHQMRHRTSDCHSWHPGC